jgi:hypothetical protein
MTAHVGAQHCCAPARQVLNPKALSTVIALFASD